MVWACAEKRGVLCRKYGDVNGKTSARRKRRRPKEILLDRRSTYN